MSEPNSRNQLAHVSYIILCRELRLEREFEEGDWYAFAVPTSAEWPTALFTHRAGPDPRQLHRTGNYCAWLSRLDQWIRLLQEATERCDFALVGFNETTGPLAVRFRYRAEWDWWQAGEDRHAEAVGDTPEEAAARLWMAVTGRQAGEAGANRQ